VLQVDNLFLELDGKPILNGLDLHVERGEIHGVLGENGTGKTTLAYIIMGVNGYRATSGTINFEGRDISELPVSQRAQMGISLAWQEPARIEGLTVHDYLSLSGGNPGLKRIRECLEAVGMDPERYLARDIDNTLSGGERKRIELASIIAMQPKLAILDEPDSGIDIVSLPIILEGMLELKRQGSSILMITHSEEMVAIADRVSVLCAGSILKTGAPAEMSIWFKENCQSCGHINEPDVYEAFSRMIRKGKADA
jgi:Fe-S cluster assembly ATP-binding protein